MNTLIGNSKDSIISRLREDIGLMEGYKPPCTSLRHISGLEDIETAFRNNIFPTGAIHEFICLKNEHTAATTGFISGILAVVMQHAGVCLWVSTNRRLFATALSTFNAIPDNIIFILVDREKEVLWATEEGLKCKGIAAVVAEVKNLTFMQSRRLQLAVEVSNATGFIVRSDAAKLSATACTARWQIIPQPSKTEAGLPGIGFPRWQVELLKARYGRPGKWIVEWSANSFNIITEQHKHQYTQDDIRKAG